MTFICRCVFVLFIVGLFPDVAQSREAAPVPDLRQVLRPAGYVFSGSVTGVKYVAAKTAGEVPTVLVTFKVEQAIRGTTSGSILTFREWAGLWNSGERYRVGERLLLFLYPRSRLGLTSAVGGTKGRFRLDRTGQVILPQSADTAAASGVPRVSRIPLREFTRAIRTAQRVEQQR